MHELMALQACLEASAQKTQDPQQLAEAKHVLHAINELKQAPSSPGSSPKRTGTGQQVCSSSYHLLIHQLAKYSQLCCIRKNHISKSLLQGYVKGRTPGRPSVVSPQHAKLLFDAGVSQLVAAMDVLDTMQMQQRRKRYVAPWVKNQAMQVCDPLLPGDHSKHICSRTDGIVRCALNCICTMRGSHMLSVSACSRTTGSC